MPDSASATTVPCPSCNARVRGRFCATCGTLAREMPCNACGALLAPGDKYCGECGARADSTAVAASGPLAGAVPLHREDWRPSTAWKVGVGTLAALLIVTLYLRFATERPQSPQPLASSATATASGAPGSGGPSGGPSAGVLSMPPQQQADALFDRVMRLSEEGKRDSVQFFAPMAMSVYERLQPLDLDQRFDLGTIALAAGMYDAAGAQADTILQKDPDHLLGLALVSRTGRAGRSAGDAAKADAHFRRVAQAQLKLSQQKPEYQRHRLDIETELKRLAGMQE